GGIAPMRATYMRRYGQTVPVLRFATDGSNDSEYLDIISARGFETQVMQALSARWEQEFAAGAVVLLRDVPETSPNLAAFRLMATAAGAASSEQAVNCASAWLPGSWNEYLNSFKPRLRTRLR